jgi:hypothetical protein
VTLLTVSHARTVMAVRAAKTTFRFVLVDKPEEA